MSGGISLVPWRRNCARRQCSYCLRRWAYDHGLCLPCARIKEAQAARQRARSALTPRAHPIRQQVYLPPPGSVARMFLGRVIAPLS